MVMCMFSTNAFAQEKVRGIETKLVQYDYDNDRREGIYGIQFTNYNSISVSIAMELWKKGEEGSYYQRATEDRIYLTKDIILKPNESYIWKINKYNCDGVLCGAGYYYYKYEAYKLQ